MQVTYVWAGESPVSVGQLAINDYKFISQTFGRGNITNKLAKLNPPRGRAPAEAETALSDPTN